MPDLRSKILNIFRRRKRVSFVARKWLSARKIRQDACLEILRNEQYGDFDREFFDAIDRKRTDYDKILWKILVLQLTITGALLLSVLELKDINFSIFGISASAIKNSKEFLLFCHAMTVAFAVVVQQHVQKLEDLLVAYSVFEFGDDTKEDNDALKIQLFKYLNPIETFNIVFLPYKRDLFYNFASEALFKVQIISKWIASLGYVSFTLLVPLWVAIDTVRHPSFGNFTYAIAIFWFGTGIFSTASVLLNAFSLPYVDYSYVKKLTELKNTNPRKYQQVHQEIASTGRLPEI